MSVGGRLLLTRPLDGGGSIPVRHIGAPISPDDAERLQDITSRISALSLSSVGVGGLSIVVNGSPNSFTVNSLNAYSSRISLYLDTLNHTISVEANTGSTAGTLAAGDDTRFNHARYLDGVGGSVGIGTATLPSIAGQSLVTVTGGLTATWQSVLLSSIATVTPTANSIPLSGAGTTINVGWIQQATNAQYGTVQLYNSTPTANSYAGAIGASTLVAPGNHQHPAGYSKGLFVNAGAATVDTTAAATPMAAGQIFVTTAAGTAAFAAGPTVAGQMTVSSGANAWTWGYGVTAAAAVSATATPTASKVPIADGSGTLNGWVTAAGISALSAVSNIGIGTSIAVYESQSGTVAQLRGVEAGSTKMSVTLDGTNHAISIDVNVGTTATTVAVGNDSRFGVAGTLTTATGTVSISAAAQPGTTGLSLVTTGTGTTATWQSVILTTKATVTPTANSIPLSGAGTTIDVAWIQQASSTVFGTVEYSASTPAAGSYAGAANLASLLVPTAGHQHPASYAKGLYVNAGAATVDTTAAATPTTSGQILSTTAAGTAAFAAGPTTSNQVPLSSAAGVWAWGTVSAAAGPANAFVTGGTNVTIVASVPAGAGQALVTTSTTSSTWTTIATMNTTVPTGLTLGGAGAAGSGATAAHVDHTHAIPALTSGQVITALGYTPTQGTGSNGVIPKFTSTASTITASQISDDGSTVTVGTIANSILRINAGTSNWYFGQLSDSTGYSGMAVNTGGINLANFVIASNITTGTIINHPNASKQIFFNLANVTYASVSSAGIAATNITATPTASKIPIADGSGTLNSWVTRAASYVSLLRIPPTGYADTYGWMSNSTAVAIGSVYLSPTLFPYPTRVVHIVAQSTGTSGVCTWTLYDIANGATVAATGTIAFNAAAGITMFQQTATLTGTGLYQLNVSMSGDTKIMIFSANFINAP